MKLQLVKGTTSKIITVFIQDSSSTTGAGLGSLDQTSSIVGGYVREGAVGLVLAVDENVTTEGTYEAPTTDNQIRIGTPANMRTGTYELHLHNDLLASGADAVFITLGGAANMADLIIEIQLTGFDLNDLTPAVNVTEWAGAATSAGVGGDGLPASIALADRNAYLIESLEGGHTYQGNHFYVDPVNGDTHASGNRGGRTDPYKTIQDCHDNAVTDSNHDVIFLVAGHASTVTTHTIAGTTTINKRYLSIRGPGRDFIITRSGSGDTLAVTADGVAFSGFQLGTAATGAGHGIKITDADFVKVEHVWILDTQGDGVHILRGSNCVISLSTFSGTGVGGTGQGVHIVGTAGVSTNNVIKLNVFSETAGDSILIEQGTTNDTLILNNLIHDSAAWGINIGASSTDAIVHGNTFGNNSSGNITDAGTTTVEHHNRDWLSATVAGRTLDITAAGEAGLDLDNTSGTISAAQLAADCITAAKLAADVATELQSGIATTADLLDKLGAVDEAAAAGDPSATESVMQYVKQIINVLMGSTGIVSMPAAAAPANNISLAEMIRAIYDDTNSLEGTKIPDTLSLNNINAEVDTALDTAMSELGVAAPTATPTVRTALMLMYMALRNKLVVQTAGTDALEIYNNAGTLIAKKLLTDDGSDYTEDEMISG